MRGQKEPPSLTKLVSKPVQLISLEADDQCRVTVNKEGHVEDDFIKLGDDAKVGPAFDGLKTTCYKVLSGASASGPHG
jgi:hypothetical protein